MKNRIALIIAYFGNLPNYFPLWLYSAEKNEDIDFILITDCEVGKHKDNIKIIKHTLSDVKARADRALHMNCCMPRAYKLCDYKPAYGLIFQDLLEGYDFWGHCDMDVVWGDIRKFITDDILDKHNKIFNLGHLTIYKNEDKVNRIFMKQRTGVYYTYKEAFQVEFSTAFDEKGAITAMSNCGNYKMYDCKEIIADIWPDTERFRTFYTLTSDYDHIYSYQDGKVIGHFLVDGKIQDKEFLYIHLQKRKMEYVTTSKDRFLIVPDSFIDWQVISEQLIKAHSQDVTPVATTPDTMSQIMPWGLSMKRKVRRMIFGHILKIDQLPMSERVL